MSRTATVFWLTLLLIGAALAAQRIAAGAPVGLALNGMTVGIAFAQLLRRT